MDQHPNTVQYSNGDFLAGDANSHGGGRLNQWVYNNNRMKLLSQVKKTQGILNELNNTHTNVKTNTTVTNNFDIPGLNNIGNTLKNESNNQLNHQDSQGQNVPINCSISDLEILQLNLQLDNHKRAKILDFVDQGLAPGHDDKESSPLQNTQSIDSVGSSSLTAKLFSQQVESAKQHLSSLEKRIMDSSSKVFITGDLNSGKSTLCNALLKRNVLPTDQLPCTNVFVEVLDSHFNKNQTEEVHAIPISKARNVSEAIEKYNQYDVTSYKQFQLKDLHDLVLENDKWTLLVVYLNDSDPKNTQNSLLHNGIVDIALIDSPGLNMDDVKTTEVFSRQEEIDLVIFVVSAENQLTLSGKDFVSLASREKQFIFFVVNKFNGIRNKERCKDLIMSQIKDASPLTYKQSSDFVHFVSSNENVPSQGEDGADGNGDNDNDNGDYPQDSDFENLRESLKNFVLKKRSKSKLLPAKTYLTKLLNDILLLSEHNINICKRQYDDVEKALTDLTPMLQTLEKESSNKSKRADLIVENTVNEIYNNTRQSINKSIDATVFPTYTGMSEIYEFINNTINAIKTSIIESVNSSEFFAKEKTEKTVNQVYELAEIQPGERPVFNKELMFQQRKHKLSKQFDVSFDIKDLFEPSWNGFFSFLQWGATVDGDVKFDTYFSSFGKYIGNPSLIFNSKIPSLLVYSFGGAKLAVSVLMYGAQLFSWNALKNIGGSVIVIGGCLGCAYLINDLPRALPSNLILKYKTVLENLDYAHSNSSRVSKVCRQVLKTPSSEITKKFDEKLINMNQQKLELNKKLLFHDHNLKFFNKLKEKTTTEKKQLDSIDLDVD